MDFNNKVPIAVEAHSKLDLPFDHATTGMFMLLQPMFYRHTLKTESLDLKFTSVVRPNPLVVPTFGRIRQNLRHFFVPYRLVFPNWEEYINDVIASNFDASSQVVGVPNFNAEDLMNVFFSRTSPSASTSLYGTAVVVTNPSVSPMNYDFVSAGVYWKLTRLGRSFYKVLYSLGYPMHLQNTD